MTNIENFDNYLFRCSSLSDIIPNQKTKELTKTIRSAIRKKFVEKITDTRKDIHSKYLDKGVSCEPESTKLLQTTIYPISKGNAVLKAIKERKENEYISGETDIIKDGIVYDLKNAYDEYTFAEAELSSKYEWQLTGYMWLNNLNKARLFYTLNNMPEHLIQKEEQNLFYSRDVYYEGDFDPKYMEACRLLRERYKYDRLPLWERFKLWDIQLDESRIPIIIDAVNSARGYMNELLLEHKEHVRKNKELMGVQ
jgi:hypothetical protein